jgi:hypothetical protein
VTSCAADAFFLSELFEQMLELTPTTLAGLLDRRRRRTRLE